MLLTVWSFIVEGETHTVIMETENMEEALELYRREYQLLHNTSKFPCTEVKKIKTLPYITRVSIELKEHRFRKFRESEEVDKE